MTTVAVVCPTLKHHPLLVQSYLVLRENLSMQSEPGRGTEQVTARQHKQTVASLCRSQVLNFQISACFLSFDSLSLSVPF